MPVDASIYGQLNQRPIQLNDPLEQYGKLISIKSLMGNEELNALQRTKLTRDLEEEQRFRDLFAGGGDMTAPDFLQRALAASPTRGLSLQKTLLDQKKTQAELTKTEVETRGAAMKQHRDQLSNVTDYPSAVAWVKSAYADPVLKPIAEQLGGPVDQVVAKIPQDPAALQQWIQKSAMNADQLTAHLTPKYEKFGDRLVDVNPVTNPNVARERAGLTMNERANLEIKAAEQTPGGAFSIPDIVARYTRPGAGQPPAGYVTPGQLLNGGGNALNAAPSAPAPSAQPAAPAPSGNPVQAAIQSGKTGQELLAVLPKNIADQLKMMVEGRMVPPTGMALRTPYWQAMMTLATQYEPQFDETVWKARNSTRTAFSSGTEAKNLTAINTAIGHLDSFDKAAQALGNGDYPLFNKLWNAVAPAVGGTETAAKIRTFEQAKEAVANELMRVFRGVGASSSDTAKWSETLNAADSPQALRAAVKSATDLLESRIGALGEQYRRGMSTSNDVDVLNMVYPKARATLERLKQGGQEQSSGSQVSAGRIGGAQSKPTGGIQFLGWEK